MKKALITDAEKRRIEGELEEGERLMWVGKPSPGIWNGEAGAIWLLVWCMGACIPFQAFVVMCKGRLSGGECMALFVLFAVGMTVISGAFLLLLSRLRRRWLYALTSKRAIVFMHGEARSYDLAPGMVLNDVTPDGGVKSLFFEIEERGREDDRSTYDWGFLYIREAAEVLGIMQEQLGIQALRSCRKRRVGYRIALIVRYVALNAAFLFGALLCYGYFPDSISVLSGLMSACVILFGFCSYGISRSRQSGEMYSDVSPTVTPRLIS